MFRALLQIWLPYHNFRGIPGMLVLMGSNCAPFSGITSFGVQRRLSEQHWTTYYANMILNFGTATAAEAKYGLCILLYELGDKQRAAPTTDEVEAMTMSALLFCNFTRRTSIITMAGNSRGGWSRLLADYGTMLKRSD